MSRIYEKIKAEQKNHGNNLILKLDYETEQKIIQKKKYK